MNNAFFFLNRKLNLYVESVLLMSPQLMSCIILKELYQGPWSSVWRDVGGPKGIEVTDLTEDVVLPHLTTDNPIDAALPAEPAFNSQVTITIIF